MDFLCPLYCPSNIICPQKLSFRSTQVPSYFTSMCNNASCGVCLRSDECYYGFHVNKQKDKGKRFIKMIKGEHDGKSNEI